jgi:hypothetical protein
VPASGTHRYPLGFRLFVSTGSDATDPTAGWSKHHPIMAVMASAILTFYFVLSVIATQWQGA